MMRLMDCKIPLEDQSITEEMLASPEYEPCPMKEELQAFLRDFTAKLVSL